MTWLWILLPLVEVVQEARCYKFRYA